MQMEYCDRDCLGGAIKGGVFRSVEGKWSEATSLRSLIRTAKEMAQVGREGRRGGEGGGREMFSARLRVGCFFLTLPGRWRR